MNRKLLANKQQHLTILREANVYPADDSLLQPYTIRHPKFPVTHPCFQPLKKDGLSRVFIVKASADQVSYDKCMFRITL
ncbi:hypothetical protein ASG81_26745 [Paenibacillus sp. Soil522]|nr:hypothetical protein ASG81_26745 [Paenibacillus sp. Soil522]